MLIVVAGFAHRRPILEGSMPERVVASAAARSRNRICDTAPVEALQ
jgi:hypothetical protein